MSAFMRNLYMVCTKTINTWIPAISTLIRSTPILLFTFGIFAIGATISILGSILSRD